ncbi:MAG: hypothetical protein ABJF50_10840 [Paracoccaceae bacterium]
MTPSAQSDAHAAAEPVAGLPFDRPDCARVGATLLRGAPEMVVCTRLGNPPLRFKGQLLTHHWMRVTPETLIEVKLWERAKKQVVVAHSSPASGQIASNAVQQSDLTAACAYLEDICANFSVSFEVGEEPTLPWAHVHLHLWFGQQFERLCADVLNDWQSISTEQEQ